MNMTESELEAELNATLALLNAQISVLEADARSMHIPFYQVRDVNGAFVAIPLLVAKAQILFSLTLFKKAH